ncbi:MAG TPA: hypothetical protein PKC30_07710 [Saprospiraceae bacterium]|nr:hypothetical protein [Saprospiraceae bacterium]
MKEKYNCIVLLMIICLITGCEKNCDYSLEYYSHVYKGLIEYEIRNYEDAYFFLNKAFKACPAKNTRTLYEIDIMAIVSAKLDNYSLILYQW